MALVSAVEQLAQARSFDAIVAIVRAKAREISASDGIAVVMRSEGCCHYIAEDAVEPLWTGQRFPLEHCVSGWAMLNGQTAVIPDIYDDERVPVDAYRTTFVKSMVMTPVGFGEPVAAIGAYWAQQGAPDPDTVQLLAALARSTAIAFENVRLNDSLMDLNATLEQRVEKAVAEADAMAQVLRQTQKMEAVGQLTGGIAHDFNNLMTVIIGNLEWMAHKLGDGAEARIKRSIASARHGAEHAAMLTQRLLAFARRQPLQPKPTDIVALIDGMSDLIGHALGETILVERRLADGLWPVEIDPHQLEATIINLAVNARDAMDGHGTLTIEASNLSIDRDGGATRIGLAAGGYVMIAIGDTGIGMPADVVGKAFEPFFTTKDVGKGTGLGLSQVYGFVKQSGGYVYIDSEPGEGTIVRLYLPRMAADAKPVARQAHEWSRAPGAGETVLVVEDHAPLRAHTTTSLRELGYDVLEAPDGPSALRLLDARTGPIDLLFTDVVMPGMTGQELARMAGQRQPGLRTLFASGYTRDAILRDGRLDDGVDFLAKPFTMAMLSRRIREAIERPVA